MDLLVIALQEPLGVALVRMVCVVPTLLVERSGERWFPRPVPALEPDETLKLTDVNNFLMQL